MGERSAERLVVCVLCVGGVQCEQMLLRRLENEKNMCQKMFG